MLICQLKTKCAKIISLLRSVTAQEWGADQRTILTMYQSLMHSRLDYGYIVNRLASRHVLRPLHAITTEALKIATGTFKSTPIDSLYILTNEMPLNIRKEYLTLKYFCKVRSQISNPACQPTVIPNNRLLFKKQEYNTTVCHKSNSANRRIRIKKNRHKSRILPPNA